MKAPASVLLVLAAMSLAVALLVPPADGHQAPASCNANNFTLSVSQDRRVVRNGEVVTYTVRTSNVGSESEAACDVTDATIALVLPAPDGSADGDRVILASGADYPAGTPTTLLGTVSHQVKVKPGVSSMAASSLARGKLHDAHTDGSVEIVKNLSTTVTQPHASVSLTPSTASGRAPLSVTYTYRVTNDSSTNAPISDVKISDEACSPLAFSGGDPNANAVLDPGETWEFTCARRFTSAGTFHNRVAVSGTNTVDSRPVPVATAEAALVVTRPGTRLSVSPSPGRGTAPLTVTYAYAQKNDGSDPISGVAVRDEACSPVTLTGGDGNGNGVLDPGETWRFSCTRRFESPGTFVNRVSATGTDAVDGKPVPVETARGRVTVVAASPPAPPPSVLGASTERAFPEPPPPTAAEEATPDTTALRPPLSGRRPIRGLPAEVLVAASLLLLVTGGTVASIACEPPWRRRR
jgi:hypothetical protein